MGPADDGQSRAYAGSETLASGACAFAQRPPRSTRTGHAALDTQCSLTDPSSIPTKFAVSSASDHEEIGPAGGVDQRRGRMPFDDP